MATGAEVSAPTEERIHLTLMTAWVTLILPTVLWWKGSVAWVAAMSLYANIAAHAAGWQAARAERRSG